MKKTKKMNGRVAKFRAGELRRKACAVVDVYDDRHDTMLVVRRGSMKQAIAAANRLLKKLGWELDEPWERV